MGARGHGPSAAGNTPAGDDSARVVLKQGEEIGHIKFCVL